MNIAFDYCGKNMDRVKNYEKADDYYSVISFIFKALDKYFSGIFDERIFSNAFELDAEMTL